MNKSIDVKNSSLSRFKILQWFKQLYHWVMGWAEHPKGSFALAFIAFIESIFFPIPVDPLLVAMGAAKPKKALWFGAMSTTFSVIGALLGYAVGFMFWENAQEIFYTYVFNQEKFQFVINEFNSNAFLAIFLAGFTPIPFKVFTLAAGVAHLDLMAFIFGSILGRGMRFMLIATLLYKFGTSIRDGLEKHFEKITIAVAVVIILAFIAYKAVP
ncbi:MAG: DedA family protein [Pseudobdellovibrionaceae bacterium]|nr:DedA family protein [Bdellovibrionales bacterium]USN47160.1 MAG: DedA family protein [Pseudobdellovibrionaceae bacterium]